MHKFDFQGDFFVVIRHCREKSRGRVVKCFDTYASALSYADSMRKNEEFYREHFVWVIDRDRY